MADLWYYTSEGKQKEQHYKPVGAFDFRFSSSKLSKSHKEWRGNHKRQAKGTPKNCKQAFLQVLPPQPQAELRQFSLVDIVQQ